METTNVHKRNAKALTDGMKYIVNQGGARSSKTFSVLQLILIICQSAKKPTIFSVVSQSLPHLRRGAIRDFQNILKTDGIWNEENWRRGDLIYTVGKAQIEFFSVDDPGKVYGPSRDFLFVNEANRIEYETFLQLAVRTRKTIFLDYNPTHEFWVHNELLNRPDVAYIHSTFKDNPYIEPSIVSELIHAGNRNENFRRVFVEGEIGVIEGVVFDNWSEGTTDDYPDGYFPTIYGQDFGFSKDPTTLVEVQIDSKNRKLYLKELFYRVGLNTAQIIDLDKHYAGPRLIIADSAEPRLISELQAAGLNIRPATKGQGSITAGLSLMASYELIVHPESVNLKKELRNYVYLDRGSQLVIDDFNHLIDASRYAVGYYFDKQNYSQPISIIKQRQNRI